MKTSSDKSFVGFTKLLMGFVTPDTDLYTASEIGGL